MKTFIATALVFWGAAVAAAQFITIDDHEVHYVLVNTLFLNADVAHRYGITRAKDRAIVNVSVIGPDSQARDATITGTTRNLLGQIQQLSFEKIVDGASIYFIAPLRFTDQDVLKFTIDVQAQDGPSGEISFQERMWVDSAK
ncbi:MAG: DUF4426 domain-containing protein [Gammaproteobacteria bacterium]|nr:DUF4426 domain-containing protein [Gammaproteobacteria bacterium]